GEWFVRRVQEEDLSHQTPSAGPCCRIASAGAVRRASDRGPSMFSGSCVLAMRTSPGADRPDSVWRLRGPPATPIIPIRGDERTQTLVPGEPPCPGRTALNGQYSSTYDAVPARTPPGHRRGDPRSPGRRPVPLAGGRRLRGDRGVA